jgi:WD40 repeat protein
MAQAEDHPSVPGDGGEPEYEPQLKYNKLGGDVPNILETQQVSCLCLSDKILALGTEDGRVHVLDYEGNEVCACCSLMLNLIKLLDQNLSMLSALPMQVTCLHPHQSRINELCFDAAEEHIASASEDESVVISSLFSDAPVRHDFRRAIKASVRSHGPLP